MTLWYDAELTQNIKQSQIFTTESSIQKLALLFQIPIYLKEANDTNEIKISKVFVQQHVNLDLDKTPQTGATSTIETGSR